MGKSLLIALPALALLAACGGDENGGSSSSGTGGSSSSGTGGSSSSGTGGSSSSGTGGSTSSGTGGGSSDIPGGGTVLFSESFDDDAFGSRGWYDGPAGTVVTSDTVSGGAFECHFLPGATTCEAGKPARHLFAASESVYLRFYLKFSSNWVGSGVAYHPHMFHFLTDADDDYIGPSNTHLTTYTEVVQGRAMLALQDSLNVDNACILLNNDTFLGCNGDLDSYVFGEDRSVCACNGIVGDLDGRDCFDSGGWFYSARAWYSAVEAFGDGGPPFDKDSWHLVEVYFEMNGIDGGVGVPDGKIRWVQDGQTLISSDAILLRTAVNETMAFNQFAMLPYIGPGSPIDQRFWVDEMVVATARPD
jgi:hypothetical protein